MSHLGMFAKHWQAGQVKTRLAASIGPSAAADIYLVFLEHLVDTLDCCADCRTLVFAPEDKLELFESQFGDTWDYQAQAQGDLGRRLSHFFHQSTRQAATQGKSIVIGSDTPHLRPEVISEVESLLDHYPVVLGPSQDGGYYLIAINTNVMPMEVDLFSEIPWSTDQVLQHTLDRLDNHGLQYHLLSEMLDVDDLAGLKNLFDELQGAADPVDLQLIKRLRFVVAELPLQGLVE